MLSIEALRANVVIAKRQALAKSREEEEKEEKEEEKSNFGSQGCAAASDQQPKNNKIQYSEFITVPYKTILSESLQYQDKCPNPVLFNC